MDRSRWQLLLACCTGIAVCCLILLTGPAPLAASVPEARLRVSVGELERIVLPTAVTAVGALTPRQSLRLTSQVPGEITWVNDKLAAGGVLAAGEVLLRVDERDYVIAVAGAQARYAQAQASIELEEGRAEIASLEWSAWQQSQGEDAPANPLALRQPQRAEATALRQVFRAELDRAQLALERTTVRAPWAGSVVQANAVVGQVLSAGDVTATLFPLDYAIVELQVPANMMRLLDAGIQRVELRPVDDVSAPAVLGTFDAVVRNLTEDTRLATVRVRVDQPLQHAGWAYGMHLEATIVAEEQRQVARIPADLIVSGNLVWVYRDQQARRHQVYPLESAGSAVAVEDNFGADDALILERPLGLFDGADVEVTGS